MLEFIIICALAVIFFLILRKLPEAKEYIKVKGENLGLPETSRPRPAIQKTVSRADQKALFQEAEKSYDNQDLPKAEKLFIKAAATDPQNPKIYERLGSIYLRWHNWQDAESALMEAIKYDPKNDNVHNNLGFALFNQKKFTESIKHYKNAISLDRDVTSRYLNLALSLDKNLKTQNAISALERALKIDPKYTEAKKLLKDFKEKLKKK